MSAVDTEFNTITNDDDIDDNIHHHGDAASIAAGVPTRALCGVVRNPLIHPDKLPCCAECGAILKARESSCSLSVD